MRRLARAYQARLNFYIINKGELPDYEGVTSGSADAGRAVVVGAVSALRPRQPHDFTFDPHSELSVEKLKDWIDQFLSGKLKKVGTAYHKTLSCLFTVMLHITLCSLRRDHRSKSCRTVTGYRSMTRREPCTSTTLQSGTKLWATSTLLCNRCGSSSVALYLALAPS